MRASLGLLAFVGLWAVYVRLGGVPSYLLPGPADVAARLAFLWSKADLWGHIVVTSGEIVGGFVLGTLLGLAAAVVFVRAPLIERAATPLVLLLQTAPKIAIAPLLLLWLGIGPAPKIALVAIVTFFPVMTGTVAGLRYAQAEYHDLAAVLRLSRWKTLIHVEAPLAMPSALAGLRVATTLAMTAAVIGELMGASSGLGYLLSSGQENGDTAAVIGIVLLLSLMGWLLHEGVRMIERRIA